MRDPFVRRQMRGEAAAGAVPEGTAGGGPRGRRPARSQHASRVEWNRPGFAAAVDIRKLEMTFTTEHGFRLAKRVSACLREPGKAIFADADDRQPGNRT